MRAFVDLDGDGVYTFGEPYDERDANLTSDIEKLYGLNLSPIDEPPVLTLIDPLDPNETFNVSDANFSTDFTWAVQAVDPLYSGNFFPSLDDSDPTNPSINVYGNLSNEEINYDDIYGNQKISFLLDGNFTEFLVNRADANSSLLLQTFDLINIPIGEWSLTYQAIDEFNTSQILTQKNNRY